MKLFITIAISIISLFASAQSQIVRQNGSTTAIYTDVPTAISSASNGDTLYIPGGIWNGDLVINKTIQIIGTGHNPDSSQATGVSIFTGNCSLVKGAGNGSLTGIYLQGGIIQTSGDSVNNYSIKRCRIDNGIQAAVATSWILTENVLGGFLLLSTSQVSNFLFSNNIFQNSASSILGRFVNSRFENNVFFTNLTCPVSACFYSLYADNSTFENNIFIGISHTTSGITNSVFRNNILTDLPNPICSGCLVNNNIANQSQNSIFINQTGSVFSYSHNYHLQSSSPGHNAGTDGNDIGIYGGMFPWKDGSLPPNPSVQAKTIQSTTDQNGNLQINVKVKAQNN